MGQNILSHPRHNPVSNQKFLFLLEDSPFTVCMPPDTVLFSAEEGRRWRNDENTRLFKDAYGPWNSERFLSLLHGP